MYYKYIKHGKIKRKRKLNNNKESMVCIWF